MKVMVYRNRRNPNKHMEVHDDGHGHRSMRQYMEWPEHGVKNYTGDGQLHRHSKATADEILDDYELEGEM